MYQSSELGGGRAWRCSITPKLTPEPPCTATPAGLSMASSASSSSSSGNSRPGAGWPAWPRLCRYLTDRDLWLPEHLERMAKLLSQADYGHTLGVHVLPDSSLRAHVRSVAARLSLAMMQTDERQSHAVLHVWAHDGSVPRAARRLGNNACGRGTDLTMFRKFMRHDTLRGQSGTWPTAVTFPTPPRATYHRAPGSPSLKCGNRA